MNMSEFQLVLPLNTEVMISEDDSVRFRTGQLKEAMEDRFYQLVNKLGDIGEIAYENVFIDGTKLEANANKYSFV